MLRFSETNKFLLKHSRSSNCIQLLRKTSVV